MKSPLYIAILLAIGSQALIFNACAPYEEDPNESISASDARYTFSVDMPCKNCIIGIPRALKKLDGVKSVDAQIGQRENLHVTFDPKKITVEEIKQALEELGKKVH